MAQPAVDIPEENRTDFGSAIGALWHNVGKILAMTGVGLCLALAYLGVARPTYTSSAELYFDPGRAVAPDAVDRPYTPDFTYVASQVAVLKSTVVLKRVVDALHLTEDTDYVENASSLAAQLKSFLLSQTRPPNSERAALAALARSLNITREMKTYVIGVDATASTPGKAMAVLEAVLNAYMEEQRAMRGAVDGRDDAKAHLEDLRQELRAAEARKPATAPPTGLAAVPYDSAAHADTIAKKGRYDQLQKALKAPASKFAFPDGVTSDALDKLRVRYANAIRKVTLLTPKLGARHPDLVDAKAQVTELRNEIDVELRHLAATAKSDYDAALANEQNLASKSASEKPAAAPAVTTDPEIERLQGLIRDAEQQAAMPPAVTPTPPAPLAAKIISPPSLPTEPSAPRPKSVLALGTLGGLALGLGWALLAGLGERRIHTLGDLARHFGRSKVVQIPWLVTAARKQLPWQKNKVSPAAQFSDMMIALAELQGGEGARYRQCVLRLLAKIKSRQRPGRPHTVMLVAPRSNAGNSSTALALAYAAALSGERVLLVDATSNNPELSTIFSTTAKPAKAIALDSKDDLNDITTRDTRSGLAFLPIALADLRTLKTLQRRRLVAGINGLSQDFDLVFIDSGAVLEDEAATCLLPVADQIVVVAKANVTNHADVETTLQLLEPAKGEISAAVLTMVPEKIT